MLCKVSPLISLPLALGYPGKAPCRRLSGRRTFLLTLCKGCSFEQMTSARRLFRALNGALELLPSCYVLQGTAFVIHKHGS